MPEIKTVSLPKVSQGHHFNVTRRPQIRSIPWRDWCHGRKLPEESFPRLDHHWNILKPPRTSVISQFQRQFPVNFNSADRDSHIEFLRFSYHWCKGTSCKIYGWKEGFIFYRSTGFNRPFSIHSATGQSDSQWIVTLPGSPRALGLMAATAQCPKSPGFTFTGQRC